MVDAATPYSSDDGNTNVNVVVDDDDVAVAAAAADNESLKKAGQGGAEGGATAAAEGQNTNHPEVTTTTDSNSNENSFDVADTTNDNMIVGSLLPEQEVPSLPTPKLGTTNVTIETSAATAAATATAATSPPQQGGGSSAAATTTVAVATVSAKRKTELLKKARHERRVWIQKAILPFDHLSPSSSSSSSSSNNNNNTKTDTATTSDYDGDDDGTALLWMTTGNEALQFVQSSTICRRNGGRSYITAAATTTRTNTTEIEDDDDDNGDDDSSLLLLPSATSVLSELYRSHGSATAAGDGGGHGHSGELLTLDQVGERVENLVQPFLNEEKEKKKKEAEAYSDDPMQSMSLLSSPTPPFMPHYYTTSIKDNNDIIVKSYHDLLSKLLLPESALLVQGIRNFVLQWQGRWKDSKQVKQAASAINAYIQSTVDSLPRSHVAWKDRRINNTSTSTGRNDGDEANDPTSGLSIRRSMESFVYNHAYNHIINHLLSVVESSSKEGVERHKLSENGNPNVDETGLGGWALSQEAFDTKLDELKFIQPSHLEIACLKDDENVGSSNTKEDNSQHNSLDTILAEPIAALLSMDMYYSPFEKLQRVLALYKAVNASLSAALNAGRDQNDKLPSADDILPTIILVCIKARPVHLLRNLEFIEIFAKPEYLRGEAGYAYTNLYGAVQFLMDLKMDETAAGSTLSISPQQLKYHLSESRTATENKQLSVHASQGSGYGINDKISNALSRSDAGIPPFDVSEASLNLSIHDVRAARLNGETIDINWAIKASETNRSSPSDTFHLPDGFSRSYGFLGADPQDIRVADLPNLLQEYRLLAEVTEGLLNQQAARTAHEKKQRDLHRQAALAEEMLLRGMTSTQ